MVEKKMMLKYRTFTSSEQMQWFFKRNTEPVVEDKIEYCVMERFKVNRILFTAEHAMRKEIEVNENGKRGYICVGDLNTDVLAKLGATYLRSAYIFPLFVRTEADAARPPEELGKGLRLFTRVFSKGKSLRITYIPIHKNRAYLQHLLKYHWLIEELNPRAIVSVHGMSVKRKFDVLFGFGDDYMTIGGKKEAFRFKAEFTDFLDRTFADLGIKNNLKIAVSTWLLMGSRNYVLARHVIDYNKNLDKSEKKRIGMQVEFNWKGRVTRSDKARPTIPYQILVQALGDFVFRWTNNV